MECVPELYKDVVERCPRIFAVEGSSPSLHGVADESWSAYPRTWWTGAKLYPSHW